MFALTFQYTLNWQFHLLLLFVWSLWSLIFSAEMRIVIIFPYACFVKKLLYACP